MKNQVVPGNPFVAKKKIQCAECKEILFSKYQGHFNRCKCEEFIFIDETNHYVRIGGKTEQIIFLEDSDTSNALRLKELDEAISGSLQKLYPGVEFRLTTLDPITLIHNSLELSEDEEMMNSFSSLVDIYCTDRESYRIVLEYDLLEER